MKSDFVTVVVWDKDPIGKDFLGFGVLSLSQAEHRKEPLDVSFFFCFVFLFSFFFLFLDLDPFATSNGIGVEKGHFEAEQDVSQRIWVSNSNSVLFFSSFIL